MLEGDDALSGAGISWRKAVYTTSIQAQFKRFTMRTVPHFDGAHCRCDCVDAARAPTPHPEGFKTEYPRPTFFGAHSELMREASPLYAQAQAQFHIFMRLAQLQEERRPATVLLVRAD
jgi:hypothetical protein